MLVRVSLCCLLLLARSAGSSAQSEPQTPGLTPVRQTIQAAIDQGTIPGAVAYVSQRDRVLTFEAMGEAAPDRAMTTDTLFAIASMSKPITSVAVMILVEEGRARLDDPLANYLPEFADVRVIDPNSGTLSRPRRAVTLRDLLTHSSGIAYGLNAPAPLRDAFQNAGLADGLGPEDRTLKENTALVAKIPLAHQPGEAWTYGMNTDVLGRVVEVASGKHFDQFLDERIFKPLKMTDTGFRVPPEKASRLAALYTPGDDGRVGKLDADPKTIGGVTVSPKRVLGDVAYLSGGAGLVSTTHDYARFLHMLLNEGVLDGVRLLKAETVHAMTRNQIGPLHCAYTIHGDKFGLGFGVVSQPGGVATVGSYSWGGIYHTFFWVDPARELVGVVMTQIHPWGESSLWADFQKAVYASIGARPAPAPDADAPRAAPEALDRGGRFLRRFPFEKGLEHGNPVTNGRFRVNDPLAASHPDHGKRSETRGNGLMQILMDEPIAEIQGAELALELWGGHPGTANKRVAVNGRGTYAIPEVGAAA
ncbi:MAG: serine hydrolase domain-containing protein, partial [Isosphaeraceae bacterium]